MNRVVQIAIVLLLLAAASFAGVTVSSPAPGATVPSPAHFVASATSNYPITGMVVYVDGLEVYRTSSNNVDTSVSLSSGWHKAVIKAWDSQGAVSQYGEYGFKVEGTGNGEGGDTQQTVAGAWNLDQVSGWIKCDACAGVVGVEDAPGWYKQGVASPSMDGKSMEFFIGGDIPYRNTLWYKGLGGKQQKHFVFDLYFYITQPERSQALEFDMNLYVDGKKFIFGHQCSPRWSKTWDIWDNVNQRWESTGIACPVFPSYKWNHVVIEAERTWDNKLHYVSITLNGVKNYMHRYKSPGSSSWYGFSVNFQMDGDYAQRDYSTWLDKVHVKYW